MFSLIIALGCLICGIIYLVAGYEVGVGWIQLALGALASALSLGWLVTRKKHRD
jgi:hypothetical protein